MGRSVIFRGLALAGGLLAAPLAAEARFPPALSCDAGGTVCLHPEGGSAEICPALDAAARQAGLERDFFARLIWRESRFDVSALSPAGARGIAQFMPGTAALRGLDDPWQPGPALAASATYLAELRDRFGSLGLAAIAYNAGERRAAEYLAGDPFLPGETRAYVVAITGETGEAWRANPGLAPDLALSRETGFLDACLALDVPEFRPRAPDAPWGVMIAAQRTEGAALRSAASVQGRFAGLLGDLAPVISRRRAPGLPGLRYVAQFGQPDQRAAIALCDRLTAAGGTCRVIRN